MCHFYRFHVVRADKIMPLREKLNELGEVQGLMGQEKGMQVVA